MSNWRANVSFLLEVPAMVPSATVVQRRLEPFLAGMRRFAGCRLAAIFGRTGLPGREELAGLKPATRALIASLAAWIALVGAVTLIAVAWVEVSTDEVLPAWLDPRGVTSVAAKARAHASFDNIVQRPLFSRSRQVPVAMPVVLPPPPMPPSIVALDRGITLKGMFINGTHAKAFLVSAQNPLGVWVQAGEDVAGWKLVSLKPQEVVLEGKHEKLVIPLSINGRPK